MDKAEKGYHKLILWEKLRELLKLTYKTVNKLPSSEDFGLKSQMKRAVVSVVSNFVEGYLKKSKKEKVYFLELAITSLLELEAQAEICLMLKFWSEEQYAEFEEKRMKAGYFLYRYKIKVNS